METSNYEKIQNTIFSLKKIEDFTGIVMDENQIGFDWMELGNKNSKMIFIGYDICAVYEDNPTILLFLNNLLSESKH